MYADLMKITKKTIVLYLVINELKSKPNTEASQKSFSFKVEGLRFKLSNATLFRQPYLISQRLACM